MTRRGYHSWQIEKARVVASRSRDPSTKCGAVIVRPDKSVCAEGYNGFPRAMPDVEVYYEEKREKHDRIIHAEMNALLAAREPLQGYTIYTTTQPCKNCAKHIIAAGIQQVIWPTPNDPSQVGIAERWAEDFARARQLFDECGVIYLEVSGDE